MRVKNHYFHLCQRYTVSNDFIMEVNTFYSIISLSHKYEQSNTFGITSSKYICMRGTYL